MIRKQLMMVSLAACVFGTALADPSKYSAPLVTERGPLRYDLTMKPDKWTFETWSSVHYRHANRSLLKHGTDSSSLPAVIFGKETFTISESFQPTADVLETGYFENQNPFFFLTKFTPQANYTDLGFTLGLRAEFPVWENKGRVGVRAALPFRTVRIERDEATSGCFNDGLEDVVIRGDQARMIDANGDPKVFQNITRYKLSLLNQLRTIVPGGEVRPILRLAAGSTGNPLPTGINGTQYNQESGATDSITNANQPQGYTAGNIPFVLMRGLGATGEFLPFQTPVAVTVQSNGNFATSGGPNNRVVYGEVSVPLTAPAINGAVPALSDLLALNPDLSQVTVANQNKGFAFTSDRDYTAITAQANFDQLWVTPVFDGSTQQMTQTAAGTVAFIDQELQRFQQGAACAFGQCGFIFDNYERTGVSDLDVDVFYEHTFNDNWRAELWLGVRFPTGGSNKFCANPYRVELGNGNHFEVKLGGNVGWQTPCNWLALKADLSYAWVLEAKEQRAAEFKRVIDKCNPSLKNIGPCICADVDWGYLTGHVDFNFYHPKSRKLGTMIGYEIYYKTEDNICFKQSATSNHCLGRVWARTVPCTTNTDGIFACTPNTLGPCSPESPCPASATIPGNAFVPYDMELDSKVAEHNTERIAHRIRTEMHWHAHRYWSFYAGGAYTFAGKNIFRETDVHGGISIRY